MHKETRHEIFPFHEAPQEKSEITTVDLHKIALHLRKEMDAAIAQEAARVEELVAKGARPLHVSSVEIEKFLKEQRAHLAHWHSFLEKGVKNILDI